MGKRLFPLFGTVVIAAWAATAVHARWIADDYCFAVAARNGFWQSQAHVYMTAAGRFSVAFFYAILTRLGPGSAPFVAIAAMLGWLVAAYYTTRSAAFAVGFVAAVLLAAPETYQPTIWLGGLLTYGLPVILATVIAALILNGARVSSPALLAFIAGGCSEVAAVAQIVLSVILALIAPRYRRALIAVAIASAVALVIVVVAPGNYARRALFHPLPVGEAVVRAAKATFPAFLGIIRDGYALLLPLALLRRGQARAPVLHVCVAPLVIIFVTLTAALAGTGLLPWGRILFVPAAYVVASVVIASLAMPEIPRAAVIAIFIVSAIGLAFSVPEKLESIREARRFAEQARAVETAPARVVNAPHTFGYLEYLSRDPAHWTNRCMADYFGIESISAR